MSVAFTRLSKRKKETFFFCVSVHVSLTHFASGLKTTDFKNHTKVTIFKNDNCSKI